MPKTQIDLRGLPVWERPARVLDVFDALAPGETLTVVTENEPRGLYAGISTSRKDQTIYDPMRVSESEWHIRLKRSSLSDDLTPFAVLSRTRVFSGLDPEIVAKVAAVSAMITARRGQVVVGDHEQWPYLGIAFEGAFALASGANGGRARLFREIFPYELFGLTAFFDDAPSYVRLLVLSKQAGYLRVPVSELRALGALHPQLTMSLGYDLAQRTRELLTDLSHQATMPIISRIANVLLTYAVPERGLAQAIAPLPNMTQSQIAASAGTVKEVAARAIAELERLNLLKRERGHVRYLDRQGLIDFIRTQA